jgi:MFS transporter, DHA1 family, tetracycline resistance protein
MESKPGKHALTFVLVTVLVDMMGIGLIVPVVPSIIRELTGTNAADASLYGGALVFAYAAAQFLCAPIIGSLSDAYGRRPLLLAAVLALGVDNALTAFAPSIAWLFAGRLVAGVCGGSYTTASAYIADITRPEDRGRAFGYIGAAFSVGFVLGPALGGLLGGFGPRIPFFVAAGLSIANALYGLLVLPETLPRELRRPFAVRHANPLGALVALKRERVPTAVTGSLFLFLLGNTVYPAVWAFYTMGRYAWDERMVGLSLATYGIIGTVVQVALVGPTIARFGERRAATLAMLFDTASLVGLALATKGWMIFALIAVGAPGGVSMPALKAVMSKRAPPEAQGALQGAIGSLEGVSSIVGPLVMTGLFSAFGGPGARPSVPGAPFFCAAALTMVALVLLARSPRE